MANINSILTVIVDIHNGQSGVMPNMHKSGRGGGIFAKIMQTSFTDEP